MSRKERICAKLTSLVPVNVTAFPFEVLMGLAAAFIGIPFLFTAATPTSLVGVVGSFMVGGFAVGTLSIVIWAMALVIGGGTILAGLRLASRPYPLVLASGLQLTALCFLVYAVAILLSGAIAAAWAGFTIFSFMAALSWLRAAYFKRVAVIARGTKALGGTPQ